MRRRHSFLLPLGVLAASAGALVMALIAQYGFGLRPCILCLIQRVPFALAALMALAALWRARWSAILMPLAGLVLMVNGAIATYHVGVEQKWWASSCASSDAQPVDLTNLAQRMSQPVQARCDEPAWQWNGITMAALNIGFSGLGGLLIVVLSRKRTFRG